MSDTMTRTAVLGTEYNHIREDISELKGDHDHLLTIVSKIDAKLDVIGDNLTKFDSRIVVFENKDAKIEERKGRYKKWVYGGLGTAAVVIIERFVNSMF